MKRGELVNSACPIDRSLSEVGDTWTLQILRDAMHGVTRFTDFSKHIGLATNILSARLQKLVAVGIFGDPRVGSRQLTRVRADREGAGLPHRPRGTAPVGQKHLFDEDEPMNRAIDARTGQPPRPMTLTAEDGRELTPDDMLIVQSRAADPIESAVPIETPRRHRR